MIHPNSFGLEMDFIRFEELKVFIYRNRNDTDNYESKFRLSIK